MTIIYPGSFDPVHYGHLRLAQYVSSLPSVDDLWIMPSRRNPLKTHATMASDSDRLTMLNLAVDDIRKKTAGCDISVSDIELELPYPSYTINTLHELKRRFDNMKFRLLIGADNWATFSRWRCAGEILADFGLMIYPRPGYSVEIADTDNVILLPDTTPQFPHSSTQVRAMMSRHDSIDGIIPASVLSYIQSRGLYNDSIAATYNCN